MSVSNHEAQNHIPSANQSAEQIERDIEGTREELDRTIDALRTRLSPRERLRMAGESVRDLTDRLTESVGEHLMPNVTGMIRLDHLHALALFRRFKPDTSQARKRALMENACLALDIHARLEEEIFYPALRAAGGDTEVLDKSKPEHDEMRRIIATIRHMSVSDPHYDRTVWELMRTVLHHVADEESILLPEAERRLAGQLGRLGRQMTKRRIELLKPHLGEIARTSVQSFPLVTLVAAAGLVTLGWMVLSRSRPTTPR